MHAVRAAEAADAAALRTVCARAYDANPLIAWALPDAATRRDACAAWLGPSLDRYVAARTVDVVTVDGTVVGLAAWRVPGHDAPPDVAASLPTPAGALRALVGPRRATEVLDALAGARELAPARPGAYLNYLAVDPAHQGRGLGAALLAHGRDRLDVPGTCWLATTDPRNEPFYGRAGFVRAGAVTLAPEGPTLVALHG